MHRLIICLPLCLLVAPAKPDVATVDEPTVASVASQESLPASDPVVFFEKCLERYGREAIKGYTAILHKQERIDGKLQPSEEIEIAMHEKPFSVFMHWLSGQRQADRVLYVAGENKDKLLVHPSGLAGALVRVVSRDPEGAEARKAGRYTLKEFGLKKATERTLLDWKEAREQGTLEAKYLGIRKVKEVGDRLCYTLHRHLAVPDREAVKDVTIYVDKETWLQVGTVLKGEDNKLIGEYMFRAVHLNPKFKPDQFLPAVVAP